VRVRRALSARDPAGGRARHSRADVPGAGRRSVVADQGIIPDLVTSHQCRRLLVGVLRAVASGPVRGRPAPAARCSACARARLTWAGRPRVLPAWFMCFCRTCHTARIVVSPAAGYCGPAGAPQFGRRGTSARTLGSHLVHACYWTRLTFTYHSDYRPLELEANLLV
jgi:hypothetical protein